MTVVDRSAPPIDPALVEAAAGGDRGAFEAIFRRRVDAVGRYVRAIVGDPIATEDAVAQTFLEAWRDLPRLRKPERFDAWLFRIAHHRGVDAAKRRRKEPPTDVVDDLADPLADPQDAAVAIDDANRVRDALSGLSAVQRDVLVHRVLLDRTHEETAARLGLTVEASRQHQSRALRLLRRRLE